VIGNYTPLVRGERPTVCWIIESGGRPVGHIQAYRVGDYPVYARAIDYDDDAWGIDLFIGEDDSRGGGFGTRALNLFVGPKSFLARALRLRSSRRTPGTRAQSAAMRRPASPTSRRFSSR
jgi:hypothetical protein